MTQLLKNFSHYKISKTIYVTDFQNKLRNSKDKQVFQNTRSL